MLDQLLETWAIHNRVNLYLLDAIPETALSNIGPSKGRSVGAQFAHLHNVRLMWLQSADKALASTLAKVEAEGSQEKGLLGAMLSASADAIASLVRAAGAEGKVKGFKPHPVAFVGYLISHESHHRGQIVLTLKQTGVPVDKKVLFGMWEWGVR
jgi:uncharacterized damage-inducible protein DinB